MRRATSEEVLRDIGRRVAELRRARHLTQEELAEGANFAFKYLQRIEAGRENLTVKTLVRLADSFGVTVGQLFRAPRSRVVRLGRPPSRRPRRRQLRSASRGPRRRT
jgi:transcriptional regulator with XRE-family HTH domain